MLDLQLFIGNQWQRATGNATFASYNPATGEQIATVADASAADVNRAIDVADTTFRSGVWRDMEPDDRATILLRVAELLRQRADEFARLECIDSGKPLFETAAVDIPYSVRALEYFANIAREVKGEVIPIPGKSVFDFQTYEPLGVVAAITPWNFPLHLFTRAVCPPLAAGNCVVAKASPLTPVTSTLIGDLFREAGLPPGVLNIVNGGAEAGAALVAHRAVRMITFTGSEAVGRSIMAANSRSPILKKMTLELGGKGPLIAAADCDIDGAVNSILVGFCLTQGQVCCASTRLYLHASIYDRFLGELTSRIARLRIGDPLDPQTQYGSLISPQQLDRVDRYVQAAIKAGARLVTGGKRLTTPPLDRGSFYPPTILAVDSNAMPCVQEEIFGPVLTVMRFHDLDAAVAMANDTAFGLGAAIWSNDTRTLFRVAKQLDAGTVWMNMNLMSTMEAPFGGNKNSGLGREYGTHGLREYMKIKNQMLYTAPDYPDFYGLSTRS